MRKIVTGFMLFAASAGSIAATAQSKTLHQWKGHIFEESLPLEE